MSKFHRNFVLAGGLLLSLLFGIATLAQETTGGLQGTVKDNTGAVVPNARVVVKGPSLVGNKELTTNGSGYFRFANLPPGAYTLSVTATGFSTVKREMTLEVGHLPTVDVTLQVGSSTEVVEVSSEAPQIDVATTRTITNITPDVVADVPHGISFQSVIQFAPAARNEPLMGNNAPAGTGAGAMTRPGTGGGSPGNTSNGSGFGYQVGGGADSENRYLIEGQDTANVAGGYSHSDVPFDFIDQVEVKSSGIEAEHGGAMGGVVNVIMKHGGNLWHGSFGADYQSDAFDANQNTPFLRYDPQLNSTPGIARSDPPAQTYTQVPNHFRYVQPNFTLGGPILRDRVWLFLGLDPKYVSAGVKVNYGSNQNNAGIQTFTQDSQTYFTTARIDAALTQKIRVFSSWLYQLQRESGAVLPVGDATNGLFNPSSTNPLFVYSHSYGFVAPNQTINVGADWTLTPQLVATTRFGYFFENYHDFGFPSGGSLYQWLASGVNSDGTPVLDNAGHALPLALQQANGYNSAGNDQNFTLRNASKHHQFDQDLAWYRGTGRFGTHNLKFGYQLNHVSNDISQRWSEPAVQISPGVGNFYAFQGPVGQANCSALIANGGFGSYDKTGALQGCAGADGYLTVQDFGSKGFASSYNHSFFAQDAWTIGHGITINAGLRVEKESLPSETKANGFPSTPISFGWGDKIAPRIGAAWDVFRDGRMKVFGSYGVFNDLMKLNLAISSFGGQYWQNCAYAMGPNFDPTTVKLAYDSAGRYCSGPDASSTANFVGGVVPAGLTFLENQNFRVNESVTSGLNPYRQHESVFGIDYAITKTLAFEARWDRRRLDHAIEDASLLNPQVGETFLIVNPGQGVGQTYNGFYQTLYGTPSNCAATGCPPNLIAAARNYDGIEMRLSKTGGSRLYGMFSYTYSSLRGNYSGLTSTDIADGGGGRNAPNNSRSFDEPFFQFNAHGGSSSGPLGTDRPNAFKGYGYYKIPWKSGWTSTSIGWFQYMYSGTPKSTVADVGFSFSQAPFSGGFPVYPEGRGKWANMTLVNNGSGTTVPTVTSVCSCRTPWYIQSDASFKQDFKLGTNEARSLSFEASITNLFNQQAVTAYYSQIDSGFNASFIAPGGHTLFDGNAAYFAYEHPYDWKSLLATDGVIGNSLYGKPLYYQQRRGIRLGVRYTF